MPMSSSTSGSPRFCDLSLSQPIIDTLVSSGYTLPTPIQTQIIPHLLAGRDVIGQAQTGTGKTAAFALPLLQNLDFGSTAAPQILVLAPTRELAVQVCASFAKYGAGLPRLKVLPVYGGQEYGSQLRALQQGVHVVVGTPGRIIDHLQRRTLDLSAVKAVVLDEADEMLKMGFIEDVQRILDHTPANTQTALFSATMPATIRRIAARYLHDPVEIQIGKTAASIPAIEQHYVIANGYKAKKNILDTLLAAQEFEAMLVFVRTKLQAVELAEHLGSRGHNCGALHGDIAQSQRERLVEQLKEGKLDILVATDVAARGLDVQRISHVVNFDAPSDCQTYIHRIGRTGRAGRGGKALLFLHPREKSILHTLKKETGTSPALMKLPTLAEINAMKRERFKSTITAALEQDCSVFSGLIEEYCREQDADPQLVAAALVRICHDKTPIFLEKEQQPTLPARQVEKAPSPLRGQRSSAKADRFEKPQQSTPEQGMDRYRIEIGESHGIKPGNIVGAIANEADISGRYIGRIMIYADHSTVDLPYGMPPHILNHLQSARIGSRMLRIRRESAPLQEDASTMKTARKKKAQKTPPAHRHKGGYSKKGKGDKKLHL